MILCFFNLSSNGFYSFSRHFCGNLKKNSGNLIIAVLCRRRTAAHGGVVDLEARGLVVQQAVLVAAARGLAVLAAANRGLVNAS